MLSNFRNFRKADLPFAECFADVDETTGRWFWARTRTRTISLPDGVGCWIFVDDGQFALEAESLARAFKSQQALLAMEKAQQPTRKYDDEA